MKVANTTLDPKIVCQSISTTGRRVQTRTNISGRISTFPGRLPSFWSQPQKSSFPQLPDATSTHVLSVHNISPADSIPESKGICKGKGKSCGKLKAEDKIGKNTGAAGNAAVANTTDAPTTPHALTSGTVCTTCLAEISRCTCDRTPLANLPRVAAAAPAAPARQHSIVGTAPRHLPRCCSGSGMAGGYVALRRRASYPGLNELERSLRKTAHATYTASYGDVMKIEVERVTVKLKTSANHLNDHVRGALPLPNPERRQRCCVRAWHYGLR